MQKLKNSFHNIECLDEVDRAVASAIAFHLVLMNCKNCIVSTSTFFLDFNTFLNIFCWALIFGNYLRIVVLKNVLAKVPSFVVVILAFLFVFCMVSQIGNTDLLTSNIFPYNYVRETYVTFLSYCLPCFVFTSVLNNPHSLLLSFYRYAWVLFIVSIGSFFLYIGGHSSSYEYSMSYANALLFSIFIFLFLFYESKKYFYIVFALLLTACLLICGSRGPLIGILSLLFVYFISIKGSLKVYFVQIMSFFSVLLLIVQQSEIINFFVNLLDKFNIQSRTLRMISTGIMTDDSHRSDYFKAVFDALNDSPLFGLGAFGGSVQVGLTHNLYLDIWANFGYFIGSAIILFMFYSLIKIFRTAPNYSLVILFFSVNIFPRGFVGFDFWASKELWVLFGLIVSFYSRLQRPS